ncbi:putative response regulator receiver Rim15p [Sclerotinia borealis F-4128]|uniref:Putative response regulator receiver Rim15p n=1 Tax=Sclerotinia borealis (strain F-4128) TaxID=1432307 RepID=W9C5V8_SCLBF|nr:putative response regulator receiver Rim15p [Sclerotinia borealis F-4128]
MSERLNNSMPPDGETLLQPEHDIDWNMLVSKEPVPISPSIPDVDSNSSLPIPAHAPVPQKYRLHIRDTCQRSFIRLEHLKREAQGTPSFDEFMYKPVPLPCKASEIKDYEAANLSVRQAQWQSFGLISSGEYLQLLFEDEALPIASKGISLVDQTFVQYPTPGDGFYQRPDDNFSGAGDQFNRSMDNDSIPLYSPPHPRDIKMRRLSAAIGSEDGRNFAFKNLQKANKDIIRKLRDEAMAAQNKPTAGFPSASLSNASSSPHFALDNL